MSNEQFALPFLDTTSLAGGLGLYGGFSAPKASPPAAIDLELEADEAPAADPALDYWLAGDRKLAQGWKARAADNLAAISLATLIEAEGRPARPDRGVYRAALSATLPSAGRTQSAGAPCPSEPYDPDRPHRNRLRRKPAQVRETLDGS